MTQEIVQQTVYELHLLSPMVTQNVTTFCLLPEHVIFRINFILLWYIIV